MVKNVSQVTVGPWQTEESLGLGAHVAEAGGGIVSLWPPKGHEHYSKCTPILGCRHEEFLAYKLKRFQEDNTIYPPYLCKSAQCCMSLEMSSMKMQSCS